MTSDSDAVLSKGEALTAPVGAAPKQSSLSEKHISTEMHDVPQRDLETVRHLAKGVADEFNNLLTVILGFDELILKQTTPGDSLHTCAEKIRAAVEKGASLTRQLVAFSGLRPAERELHNLHKSVLAMVERIREIACASIEVRIECLCDPASTWIEADPVQVQDVIFDLAGKACDEMPQGGVLRIYISMVTLMDSEAEPLGLSSGKHVLLSIHDTGCGITEEMFNHVFEPFFTMKSVGSGTGLALAACYGIVRENGGCIRVATERGRGTTFEILFPEASPVSRP